MFHCITTKVAMKYRILLILLPHLCFGQWAEQTLENLSLREKIGQLFVVAAVSEDPKDSGINLELIKNYTLDKEHIEQLITSYGIGGIIFLCKSTPEKQRRLTQHFQQLSPLPLLMCQDCEWGLTQRLRETLRFPRNMTLGAIQNEKLIYDMAYEIGRQCRAIGVHLNLAPVIDVNNNPDNPVINDRSFGENKKRVALLGEQYYKGLSDAQVIPCAKHFPGHGDTAIDSHYALPCIPHTQERLTSVELYPFKQLINQGIPAIMTAHLSIPAYDTTLPSSLSYPLVTELLQHTLGFKGLVITDGLGMDALVNHYAPGEIELKAFLAGNDILLCPVDVPKAIDLIEQAITKGTISEKELDKRVLKILQAKESVGTSLPQEELITPEALKLKCSLYESAITLVRNEQVLPLSPETTVIQIGAEQNRFTAFFDSIHYLASAPSEESIHQVLKEVKNARTVIVSLFGMNKYSRKNFGIADNSLSLIKELQKNHHVVLTIFGNPYSLKNFGNESAIIVAYEDDPDAQQAAAKVLLGQLAPQGKLPVTASEQFKAGDGLD